MAFDGFIKIKGIDGESSDGKHQGWIEIGDCNMEILQTVSATASSSGGASAERADFSDFCFTKLLQAISKKGFWFQIAAEAKFKPEAYSSIPRI